VQPTSLRSWVSGRDFGKLVVLQAVVVGRRRSAADAHVGQAAVARNPVEKCLASNFRLFFERAILCAER
jgi:hypothetical protein